MAGRKPQSGDSRRGFTRRAPAPRGPAAAISPQELLERALDRRAALLRDPAIGAVRLFHDQADGIPGLVIEKFGDVLVAQLHEGRLTLEEPDVRLLCESAARHTGARAVYRKRFPRDRSASQAALAAGHADPHPWIGEPIGDEFPVRENDAVYLIRPFDGYSVGLFIEQRGNRQLLRLAARGRQVLNTFAYTCAFSIAAALGGAAGTVSVDVSKKYLEWGKRNFAANGLDLASHTFIRSDVLEYYRRAARQQRRFDLIILDPPTFGRDKETGKAFSLADDLDELQTGAVELLNPGGELLICTNHRGTSLRRLELAVSHAAAERPGWSIHARPALPPDFAGDDDFAKSLWVRVR